MTTITDDEQGEGRDGLGRALRTKVELWIAIVFMALTFGAGITIGVIAQHAATPSIGTAQTNQVPSNFGIAPPLTQQQLQEGLPSGHPTVAPTQGGSGSGTGSPDTGSGSKGGGSQPSASPSGTG